MRKKKLEYTEIPDWAIDKERKDGPAMSSALALTKLEGKEIRLTAAMQRKLLGFPVFGKQSIRGHDDRVTVCRKVGFGLDFDCHEFHWNEVTKAAKDKKKL
jgi:hypothetical protein